MKLLNKLFVVIFIAIGLSACSSPARMNAMIPDVSEATIIDESSPLAKAVLLGDVTGGKETNPMWTSQVGNEEFQGALKNALIAHALLAEEGGRYKLTAELQELDQPVIGTSLTVTSTVRYVIIDTKSNTTVFDKVVVQPYTAKFSDAFLGNERLRLANEGAIRVNIQDFLEKLISKSQEFEQLSDLGFNNILVVEIASR